MTRFLVFVVAALITSAVSAQSLSVSSAVTLTSNASYSSISVSNGGTLTINAGVVVTITTSTGFSANGGATIVKGTLVIAPSGTTGNTLSMGGGSTFTVNSGGQVTVNGNVNMSGNPTMTINGSLATNGNFAGSGSVVVSGDGSLTSTGSMTSSGSATIYGSTVDCSSGPCSADNLCKLSTVVNSPQTICSGSTATTLAAASQPGTASLQWQESVDNATYTDISGATGTSLPFAPGRPSSTSFYRLKVDASGCQQRTSSVQVAVVQPPSTAVAGTSQNQCENSSFVLSATPPTIGSGTWSISGASNGATITNPTSPNATVSGLTPGYDVTLVWTVANGSCPVNTASLTLTNGTNTSGGGLITCGSMFPVEWLSFEAAKDKQNATLEWATASEENNAHFEIERSVDGKSFVSVGEVAGAGTSSSPSFYTFTDQNVAHLGTVWYRLRQVDIDGQFSLSETRSVFFEDQTLHVALQPNPAQGYCKAFITLPVAESATVQLVDLTGKKIFETQIMESQAVDLPIDMLNAGLYFVEAVSSNSQQIVRLVIE